MYIKALRNQGYKCGAQSNFTGGTKPRRGQGRERPCFAVCALVCDLSPKAECVPAFACESKRGPFVREVEKRDERWSEIELLLIVGPTENREMYVYKSTVE